MVSHCQESTIEFGHALDSRFRHFAFCFWYCKKTWNRAKTIFGAPSILPPPKKNHFLPRTRDFSRKRVCGFSNRQLQENVFNRANLFGGQSLCSPHLTPQIQCLPEQLGTSPKLLRLCLSAPRKKMKIKHQTLHILN
jgi:hypothetical protein